MKKMMFLAVTAILAGLVSCGKIESQIEDLRGKIENVEQKTISTIKEQLTSVNASITDLQKANTEIEGKISSINKEIDALKISGEENDAKIKELEESVQKLETAKEILNERIDGLKEYAEELNGKMEEFKELAQDKIAQNELWARTSLVSLEQWEETKAALEAVKQITDGIEEDIRTAVSEALISMTNYVNNQLDGYTTIAEFKAFVNKTTSYMESFQTKIEALEKDDADYRARIADLQELLKTTTDDLKKEIESQKAELEAKIADNEKKLEELSAELEEQKKALEDTNEKIEIVKNELKADYEALIRDAIDKCHGEITAEIKAAIKESDEQFEAKFEEIETEIEAINNRIAAVEDDIKTINEQSLPEIDEKLQAILIRLGALEGMIQSITFIPDYSDGKARLELNESRTEIKTETLILKFLVSPAEMADSIVKYQKNLSIKARTLSNTGMDFFDLAISEYNVNLVSKTEGIIGLEIKTKDLPLALGMKDFTLSVAYNDGLNNISSNFVTVTMANPVWKISCYDGDTGVEYKDSATVFVGLNKDKNLRFTAEPDASYDQFSYTSDNLNIATVKNSGKRSTYPQATISTSKEGKVAMHASLPDLGSSYSANVFTFFVQIGDMTRTATFDVSSVSLAHGDTYNLKEHLTINPALTADDVIEFSMQGNAVTGVSLSPDGVITNDYTSNSNATRTFRATVKSKTGRYDDVIASISVTFLKMEYRTIAFNPTTATVEYGGSLNLRDYLTATPAITSSDKLTYARQSGTIPSGVSFNSDTGEITNESTSENDVTVTFNATIATTIDYLGRTTQSGERISVTFKTQPKAAITLSPGSASMKKDEILNLREFITSIKADGIELTDAQKAKVKFTTNSQNASISGDVLTDNYTSSMRDGSCDVTVTVPISGQNYPSTATFTVTLKMQTLDRTISTKNSSYTLNSRASLDLADEITGINPELTDGEKVEYSTSSRYLSLNGSTITNTNTGWSDQRNQSVTIKVAAHGDYKEATKTISVLCKK